MQYLGYCIDATMNGWDWKFHLATFNLNRWLKKVKQKFIRSKKKKKVEKVKIAKTLWERILIPEWAKQEGKKKPSSARALYLFIENQCRHFGPVW